MTLQQIKTQVDEAKERAKKAQFDAEQFPYLVYRNIPQLCQAIELLLADRAELMRALNHYSQRTVYFKDGGQIRYKSGSTTPFYSDEEWCESDFADEAIKQSKERLGE